jgi:hypothetical protein
MQNERPWSLRRECGQPIGRAPRATFQQEQKWAFPEHRTQRQVLAEEAEAMRRTSDQPAQLSELVALVAREVRHRRKFTRRSEEAIAAEILTSVEMPDISAPLQRLREAALDRALDAPSVTPKARKSARIHRLRPPAA